MTSDSNPFADLRQFEQLLWSFARERHHDYQRGRYDGWVLCPRAHAEAHLRCILDPRWLMAIDPIAPEIAPRDFVPLVRDLFAAVGRFFPGDDLVFAVGDVQ